MNAKFANYVGVMNIMSTTRHWIIISDVAEDLLLLIIVAKLLSIFFYYPQCKKLLVINQWTQNQLEGKEVTIETAFLLLWFMTDPPQNGQLNSSLTTLLPFTYCPHMSMMDTSEMFFSLWRSLIIFLEFVVKVFLAKYIKAQKVSDLLLLMFSYKFGVFII